MIVTTKLRVTGMTCDHCARAVAEELARLESVSSVQVDLVPAGESVVTVASAGPLAERAVAATLDAAGEYRIAGL
jgi:copper chaperone